MMSSTTNSAAASAPGARLSSLEWLLCAIVGLGFVFDTFEIVVMSITVRPALMSLGMDPGTATFNHWVGVLLYVPGATAGLFGVLGGYLIDVFGRRRALVWSLLLYTLSTVAAATASSPVSLLVWRCFTLIGVALEFVAALTWLAELFPEPKRREMVLGYSQIASGAGNFVVTATYYLAVTYGMRLPAINGHHDAWRYTLAIGMLPAIPLMLVRSRLPESPLWAQTSARGKMRRPSVGALFAPALRRSTIAAMLVTACVYAGAYGVLQQIPRLVPGLPDVRTLSPRAQEQIVSLVHLFGSLGEVCGRLLFAIVVVTVVRQRRLLRTFMISSLAVVPVVLLYASTSGVAALTVASFVATLLVMAQFSFVGNYLPRLFPTHLRGTGESVAVNIGGRLIGTSAAFITPQLASMFSGPQLTVHLSYAMATVAAVVFAAGCVVTNWMPEPTAVLPDAID